MAKRKLTDYGQYADEPINQPPDTEQRHRHQHAALALDRIKIGQMRQRRHIFRCQNVLLRIGHALTHRFRELQDGLPQMREMADHHPRLARCKADELRKKLLAIV